ncbi:Solute carrier family 22 member 22 [Hondaea fermentalgiana]|uniref:Solute carrier family 22 member 22 n=1 Tax=Hondaea fermentalgiana TaxID=2315210 RepID=A0A2R5G9C6_9STRA|nr:Solute carrier family 22 member 22 [Hondaea fermentalgiana]|eukprot:GBG26378.1 Solute carrier family 22 member 22 [Hondaea fermentalgiana]
MPTTQYGARPSGSSGASSNASLRNARGDMADAKTSSWDAEASRGLLLPDGTRRRDEEETKSAGLDADAARGDGVGLVSNDAERFRLLDRAIEEVGGGPFQHMMMAVAAVGFFVESAEMAIVGLLYPVFVQEWAVKETELAIIKSLTSLGMVLGCLASGSLADVYGRKTVYFWSLFLSVAFGFASSWAEGVTSFAVLRLFVGIGYGGVSVTAIPLLLEVSPAVSRGRYTAIKGYAWCLGSTVIIVLSWALMDRCGWRWLVRAAAVAGVPALYVLHSRAPESMRFSIMHGRFRDAIDSFRVLARMNGSTVPSFLTESNLRGRGGQASVGNCDKSARTKTWAQGWRSGMKQYVAKMSDPRTRTTLFPLLWLWALNSAGMTILGFLPFQLKKHLGGDDTHFQVAFVSMLGEWIGSTVVAFFAFKLRRVSEIRLGEVLTGVAVVAVGTVGREPVAIFALLVALRVGMAISKHGMFTYTPEVMPTEVRVQAFGVCQFVARVVPVFSPYLLTYLDTAASFPVTAAVHGLFFCLAAATTLALTVETANLPLVERDFSAAQSEAETSPILPLAVARQATMDAT